MACLQGSDKEKRDVGGAAPQKRGRRLSSVVQRWLTAVVAIPIVLAFVWFGGWWAFIATVIVATLCCFELHTMFLHIGQRPLSWVSLGLCILFLAAALLPQQRLLLLDAGIGASILLAFPILLWRKNIQGTLVDWALTLAIAFYIGWPLSYFLLFRQDTPAAFFPASGGFVSLSPGGWWLLVTLLGVWSFDGAAFFSGRHFGRHKLAPHISPAKTWEGVAGGLVACIISCLVITVVPLGLPWYLAVLLALLIGAAATLGDLAESLIKRQTQVKDSGQIMPGHGGMLDRVDSLLFAVIVVYIFSQFIG